jgi:hypothetical protein
LSKYQTFFSKIQDGAHIRYGVFWHLFLEALAFVRNFKMQKFLHFLEEQTPKKNLKNVVKNLIQNGRYMATKTRFTCKNYKSSFFKKNFRAVLVA